MPGWKRALSAVTAAALVAASLPLPQVYAAAGPPPGVRQLEPSTRHLDPATIVIPETLGDVVEAWRPADRAPQGMVIHLQDLHAHPEAQEHIARLLDDLSRRYGVRLAAVEGASGACDTQRYADLPDPPSTELAARLFMREGIFTGAEYVAITRPGRIGLWGVEDAQPYLDHLEAYRALEQSGREFAQRLATLSDALAGRQAAAYPRALRRLAALRRDGRRDASDAAAREYLRELLRASRAAGVDLRQYPRLDAMAAAEQLFARISPRRVEEQRLRAMRQLREQGASPMQLAALRETMQRNAADGHEQLARLAASHGIALDRAGGDYRYDALRGYVAYLRLARSASGPAAHEEADALLTALERVHLRTEPQRALARTARHVDILAALAAGRALPGDYEYYRRYRAEFSPARLATDLAEAGGAPLPGSDHLARALEVLPAAERFYELAGRRDDALAGNALARLEQEPTRTIILIAGGFHTPGILRVLRARDIAYLVVAPRVSQPFDEARYRDSLANELPALEQLQRAFDAQALAAMLKTGRLFQERFAGASDRLFAMYQAVKASASDPEFTAPFQSMGEMRRRLPGMILGQLRAFGLTDAELGQAQGLMELTGDLYAKMGLVDANYHNHVHNLAAAYALLTLGRNAGLLTSSRDAKTAFLAALWHDFHLREARIRVDGAERATPAFVAETLRQLRDLLGLAPVDGAPSEPAYARLMTPERRAAFREATRMLLGEAPLEPVFAEMEAMILKSDFPSDTTTPEARARRVAGIDAAYAAGLERVAPERRARVHALAVHLAKGADQAVFPWMCTPEMGAQVIVPGLRREQLYVDAATTYMFFYVPQLLTDETLAGLAHLPDAGKRNFLDAMRHFAAISTAPGAAADWQSREERVTRALFGGDVRAASPPLGKRLVFSNGHLIQPRDQEAIERAVDLPGFLEDSYRLANGVSIDAATIKRIAVRLYSREGTEKLVYRMEVHGPPRLTRRERTMILKVVRPEAERRDPWHARSYDKRLLQQMRTDAVQLHAYHPSLSPLPGVYTEVVNADGEHVVVLTDALVPGPTNWEYRHGPAVNPAIALRRAARSYMASWLALNRERFIADPKQDNLVLEGGEDHGYWKLIDLDHVGTLAQVKAQRDLTHLPFNSFPPLIVFLLAQKFALAEPDSTHLLDGIRDALSEAEWRDVLVEARDGLLEVSESLRRLRRSAPADDEGLSGDEIIDDRFIAATLQAVSDYLDRGYRHYRPDRFRAAGRGGVMDALRKLGGPGRARTALITGLIAAGAVLIALAARASGAEPPPHLEANVPALINRAGLLDGSSRLAAWLAAAAVSLAALGRRFFRLHFASSPPPSAVSTEPPTAAEAAQSLARSEILHPLYVRHNLAVRRAVNPGHRPLTAIYGGAGVDLTNHLLSTGASTSYFVAETYPFTAEELRAALRRGRPAGLIKPVEYLHEKFLRGYGPGYALSTRREVLDALLVELMALGLDPRAAGVDEDDGHPRIRFRWTHPEGAPQSYAITFIGADITRPDRYPPLLQRIAREGFDLYHQRAGQEIAWAYGKRGNHIEALWPHLNPGGAFITDDHVDWNTPAPAFPVAAEAVVVPDAEATAAAIRDLQARVRRVHHVPGYGWDVTVRRAPLYRDGLFDAAAVERHLQEAARQAGTEAVVVGGWRYLGSGRARHPVSNRERDLDIILRAPEDDPLAQRAVARRFVGALDARLRASASGAAEWYEAGSPQIILGQDGAAHRLEMDIWFGDSEQEALDVVLADISNLLGREPDRLKAYVMAEYYLGEEAVWRRMRDRYLALHTPQDERQFREDPERLAREAQLRLAASAPTPAHAAQVIRRLREPVPALPEPAPDAVVARRGTLLDGLRDSVTAQQAALAALPEDAQVRVAGLPGRTLSKPRLAQAVAAGRVRYDAEAGVWMAASRGGVGVAPANAPPAMSRRAFLRNLALLAAVSPLTLISGDASHGALSDTAIIRRLTGRGFTRLQAHLIIEEQRRFARLVVPDISEAAIQRLHLSTYPKTPFQAVLHYAPTSLPMYLIWPLLLLARWPLGLTRRQSLGILLLCGLVPGAAMSVGDQMFPLGLTDRISRKMLLHPDMSRLTEPGLPEDISWRLLIVHEAAHALLWMDEELAHSCEELRLSELVGRLPVRQPARQAWELGQRVGDPARAWRYLATYEDVRADAAPATGQPPQDDSVPVDPRRGTLLDGLRDWVSAERAARAAGQPYAELTRAEFAAHVQATRTGPSSRSTLQREVQGLLQLGLLEEGTSRPGERATPLRLAGWLRDSLARAPPEWELPDLPGLGVWQLTDSNRMLAEEAVIALRVFHLRAFSLASTASPKFSTALEHAAADVITIAKRDGPGSRLGRALHKLRMTIWDTVEYEEQTQKAIARVAEELNRMRFVEADLWLEDFLVDLNLYRVVIRHRASVDGHKIEVLHVAPLAAPPITRFKFGVTKFGDPYALVDLATIRDFVTTDLLPSATSRQLSPKLRKALEDHVADEQARITLSHALIDLLLRDFRAFKSEEEIIAALATDTDPHELEHNRRELLGLDTVDTDEVTAETPAYLMGLAYADLPYFHIYQLVTHVFGGYQPGVVALKEIAAVLGISMEHQADLTHMLPMLIERVVSVSANDLRRAGSQAFQQFTGTPLPHLVRTSSGWELTSPVLSEPDAKLTLTAGREALATLPEDAQVRVAGLPGRMLSKPRLAQAVADGRVRYDAEAGVWMAASRGGSGADAPEVPERLYMVLPWSAFPLLMTLPDPMARLPENFLLTPREAQSDELIVEFQNNGLVSTYKAVTFMGVKRAAERLGLKSDQAAIFDLMGALLNPDAAARFGHRLPPGVDPDAFKETEWMFNWKSGSATLVRITYNDHTYTLEEFRQAAPTLFQEELRGLTAVAVDSEEIPYLYRAISESEWEGLRRDGYLTVRQGVTENFEQTIGRQVALFATRDDYAGIIVRIPVQGPYFRPAGMAVRRISVVLPHFAVPEILASKPGEPEQWVSVSQYLAAVQPAPSRAGTGGHVSPGERKRIHSEPGAPMRARFAGTDAQRQAQADQLVRVFQERGGQDVAALLGMTLGAYSEEEIARLLPDRYAPVVVDPHTEVAEGISMALVKFVSPEVFRFRRGEPPPAGRAARQEPLTLALLYDQGQLARAMVIDLRSGNAADLFSLPLDAAVAMRPRLEALAGRVGADRPELPPHARAPRAPLERVETAAQLERVDRARGGLYVGPDLGSGSAHVSTEVQLLHPVPPAVLREQLATHPLLPRLGRLVAEGTGFGMDDAAMFVRSLKAHGGMVGGPSDFGEIIPQGEISGGSALGERAIFVGPRDPDDVELIAHEMTHLLFASWLAAERRIRRAAEKSRPTPRDVEKYVRLERVRQAARSRWAPLITAIAGDPLYAGIDRQPDRQASEALSYIAGNLFAFRGEVRFGGRAVHLTTLADVELLADLEAWPEAMRPVLVMPGQPLGDTLNAVRYFDHVAVAMVERRRDDREADAYLQAWLGSQRPFQSIDIVERLLADGHLPTAQRALQVSGLVERATGPAYALRSAAKLAVILHRHGLHDPAQAITQRVAERIDQLPMLVLNLQDQAPAFRELAGAARFQGWVDGETAEARRVFFEALADPGVLSMGRVTVEAERLVRLGALTGRLRSDVLGELYAQVRHALGPDLSERMIRAIEGAVQPSRVP